MMHSIYPITEQVIRPYIGSEVCAVLHDGRRISGTLQDCRTGQLYVVPAGSGTGEARIRSSAEEPEKAEISYFGLGAIAIALTGLALLYAYPYRYPYPRYRYPVRRSFYW